jgi:hypothetical protein
MSERDKSQPARHQTEYFVNGEIEHTTASVMTMAAVLEGAGFTPASNWDLQDDANGKQYTDLAEDIHIHEKQHFTATYKGVTPTS